jgi:hypothetical protein
MYKSLTFDTNQAQYQTGQQDGVRYYGEGHTELMERYKSGTPAYQMGFESAKDHPRVIDPDFAS